jgi:hypothetical protein
MAHAIDVHRPYALVSLGSRLPLYITCACRREILDANLRLWHSGLMLRYVPMHHRLQPRPQQRLAPLKGA